VFAPNQAFGIASASFGAVSSTQILTLQRQINRFLSDDDFGFAVKIDETGVMSSETIAQLPRAARNALAIVGPLGAVFTASLLPAAVGMDDDDILANLDALVAAFSQITIPTVTTPLIQITPRPPPPPPPPPPKKKFFDARNPMLWVVVGGSVVALAGIGVLLRRKPAATPMGKRRRLSSHQATHVMMVWEDGRMQIQHWDTDEVLWSSRKGMSHHDAMKAAIRIIKDRDYVYADTDPN
jgi:hypothetical protein